MKLLTLIICIVYSNLAYAKTLTIKLSTQNWYPYVGQSSKKNGITQNIVEAAFNAQGYNVETNFMPWDSAISETKSGSYDAIFPISKDSERSKYLIFSEPIFYDHMVFLVLKESNIKYNKYKDLNKTYDELKKYRFGIVRGYTNEKFLDARKDLIKIISNDDFSNIKKLRLKIVNIIYIDKYVANFLFSKMKPEYKNEFKFLEPEIKSSPLFIAFSKLAKDSEKKARDFNEGLRKIKENNTYEELLDKAEYFH